MSEYSIKERTNSTHPFVVNDHIGPLYMYRTRAEAEAFVESKTNVGSVSFMATYQRLGGNISFTHPSFVPEMATTFMIVQPSHKAGPYVCASDYLLLLKLYQELKK